MDVAIHSTTTTAATVTTKAAEDAASNAAEDGAMTEGEKLAVSILLVALSVFGTFGNGLVLYVFTRKSDKVTSTIFILSLAWCDFFTCLIIMPYTVANIQLEDFLVYDVICKLYHFLITSNVPLSAFIMVAVAVDRYFSICHPFLHAVTPRRARISILCLCLFAFSLGTITACMFGVYVENKPNGTCSNQTDHNASRPDVIDISKGTGNGNEGGGSISSQGTSNITKFVYNYVEVVIDDNQYGRQRQQQQFNNNNTTPNAITSPDPPCSSEENAGKFIYEGYCSINEIIFSQSFFLWYHKIYISFYIICLLSVFMLYFLIYRSVVKRRAWRRKQKSWAHSPMTAVTNNAHNATTKTALPPDPQNADGENMELNPKTAGSGNREKSGSGGGDGTSDRLTDEGVTDSGISGCKHSDSTPPASGTAGGHKESGCENGTEGSGGGGGGGGAQVSRQLSSSAEKKTSRERRDFNFLANIRTAVMLFVVTIVFIISFLPAWLMATYLIDYHVFVFYMYFIYNVANPVIYAFMNQSFRKELKRVFQRGTHFFRSG